MPQTAASFSEVDLSVGCGSSVVKGRTGNLVHPALPGSFERDTKQEKLTCLWGAVAQW